jgi:hypothetical protein
MDGQLRRSALQPLSLASSAAARPTTPTVSAVSAIVNATSQRASRPALEAAAFLQRDLNRRELARSEGLEPWPSVWQQVR